MPFRRRLDARILRITQAEGFPLQVHKALLRRHVAFGFGIVKFPDKIDNLFQIWQLGNGVDLHEDHHALFVHQDICSLGKAFLSPE